MEISNIIKYLRHRDYLVTITNTCRGCIVSFPAQQLLIHTSERYGVEFIIDWTTGTVIVDNLNSRKTYEFPLYLIRIFILYFISCACGVGNYNTDLIYFEIDGCEVDEDRWLKECFERHLDQTQNDKSTVLLNIMLQTQSCNDYAKLAKEKGVLEGYELMKTWVEISKDA